MRLMPRALVLHRTARLGLLAALGLFLIINGPAAFMKSLRRIKQGWALRDEGLIESRKRLFGADYVDGIEAIRKSIPPDGDYLLAREKGAEEYADLWVRYDLAPRRALFLDQSEGLLEPGFAPPRRPVDTVPQLAVIARGGGKAPRLLATALLLRELPRTQPEQQENVLPPSQ